MPGAQSPSRGPQGILNHLNALGAQETRLKTNDDSYILEARLNPWIRIANGRIKDKQKQISEEDKQGWLEIDDEVYRELEIGQAYDPNAQDDMALEHSGDLRSLSEEHKQMEIENDGEFLQQGGVQSIYINLGNEPIPGTADLPSDQERELREFEHFLSGRQRHFGIEYLERLYQKLRDRDAPDDRERRRLIREYAPKNLKETDLRFPVTDNEATTATEGSDTEDERRY